MTKKEFIDTYLNDYKILEIVDSLGWNADNIEYDSLIKIIKESYCDTVDEYSDGEEINDVNFREFDEDVMYNIKEKIGIL